MSFELPSKPHEPLMRGEEDYHDEPAPPRHRNANPRSTFIRCGWMLLGLLVAAVVFGLGVSIGKGIPTRKREGLLIPDGEIQIRMEYNSTFSQHPSPETDAAWASLFPKGVGFVKHPTLAPELSGLVVFHALHCLNALREVYYAAVDGQLPHVADEHDHMKDPHHVRHCFDYLRQSLMCAADTNLEPVDKELQGVTGWGYSRTCRDYESVKAWAEAHWSNDPS
ncbi:uncharacterized protein BO66DRAFT_392197 [Aspergillus aculeatinus CBS 121060]|uniref:Uncharacterized protein n=2 Tax=Aspergillus subgen. Circumdati TaxID=2720871 RepID=A0ACD1H8S5_9EURO|nr:hypothetical protein BO66DRAFT_392197 [Aspergillus aculeatinus CBS 121060]RAH69803.1 hypothetical protein BO66DRAFT_392197 [Aspergillus aculeatinus CBS 121060]